MTRERLLPALLFFLVAIVYLASPNATPFDSRWTVFTSLSLIHEGNADLNEYLPRLEADEFYGIECVFPDGHRIYPVDSAAQCAGARVYNFFPVGVPLVTAPAVAAIEWVGQHVTWRWAGRLPSAAQRSLLSGRLTESSMAVELVLASFLVAGAVVVLFLFARELTGWREALALALVMALATPAWSTGSRALWMHGFSMLLLPAALWALWRGRFAWAGFMLMLAFFLRPTNAVPFAVAGIWVLWRGRAAVVRFALGAVPVAAVFMTLNVWMYGFILAPFFFGKRPGSVSLGLHARLGEALLGLLVSPSRGLFIYTPVFLFSLWGLWLWRKDETRRPIALYIAAVALAHYGLMACYEDWFGGHSYGPRYFSDLTPLFVLALIPVWTRMRNAGRAAMSAAVVVSVFMHAQGALCWPCVDWNMKPVSLRDSQWRLWDWRDPAFLRNWRRPANAAVTAPAPQDASR